MRTRPSDGQRVLATEVQAEQIEEQRAIVNGNHEQYLAEKKTFEQEKIRLTKLHRKSPSGNDVKWSILNQQLVKHAKSGSWGLYRNTKVEMAEILRKESRLESALSTYLEVCYLDINGPQNTGNRADFLPFSVSEAFIAPGIVNRVLALAEKLNYRTEQTEQAFHTIAEVNHRVLRLPVSPGQAWAKLKTALYQDHM